MSETQGQIIAPDNYRKLCEPFASPAEAEKALTAFWEEFYELRNKHRIADAHVICRVPVLSETGEGIVRVNMHAGDEMLGEEMTAFAFGQEGARRQSRIASMFDGSIKTKKPRK